MKNQVPLACAAGVSGPATARWGRRGNDGRNDFGGRLAAAARSGKKNSK
jgi:hypothetical protein